MFGNRIKTARKNKGLTQKQLADIVGIKHNTLSGWEKGAHSPNGTQIIQLCDVLEIDPNSLYGKEGSEIIRNTTVDDYLTGSGKELPEEAKKELNTFIEYLKVKYKGK